MNYFRSVLQILPHMKCGFFFVCLFCKILQCEKFLLPSPTVVSDKVYRKYHKMEGKEGV